MSKVCCSHVIASKRAQGFTLIELVVVIILLGILSVGVTSFLKTGTQIYVDNSNRNEIIASARFAIERLNRELRTALPYSLVVSNNASECLTFTPIITSAVYLDIPVAPESERDNMSVIKFNESLVAGDFRVAVYPLNSDEVYTNQGKVHTLTNASIVKTTTTQWDVSFNNKVLFAADSPTKRLFFIDSTVSYCMANQELRRFVGAHPNSGAQFSDGVLMAQYLLHLPSYFSAASDRQNRNATVQMTLVFERNDELVEFNNEVQIANVP